MLSCAGCDPAHLAETVCLKVLAIDKDPSGAGPVRTYRDARGVLYVATGDNYSPPRHRYE